MEIGLTRSMFKRPIGQRTTVVLDDGGHRKLESVSCAQAFQIVQADCRIQLETIVESTYRQFGRHGDVGWRHPLPIGLKAINCPLERGGEIELVVGSARGSRGNKGLKTRVLPKAIRARGWGSRWDAHVEHV